MFNPQKRMNMAKSDLNSAAWCDLVFAEKNKEYGAYQMRAGSARRHTIAVVAVVGIALLGFCLPMLVPKAAPQAREVITEVTVLSQLEESEVKQEEMKRVEPVAPPPPALKSSIKFTAPVIKKDAEVSDVDEIKGQEELTQSAAAISIADVTGNDEEHGQDIADLEQVVVQAPEEEPQVFEVAEQMPRFPGGTAALMKFISKHLKYPQTAVDNGVQGRVTCRFLVGQDGTVSDVEILKPLDPYCDKEAVRVILSMPRWIPGRQNGEPVSVRYTVPITFRIK